MALINFRIDADGEYEDKLIKANKLIADKPPEFIYEGGSMIKAVCEYAKSMITRYGSHSKAIMK